MPIFNRRREWPEGLSMLVTDTYFIALGSRGTSLLGQLAGTGALRPGDIALHDGVGYPIERIDVFKAMLKEAGPGQNIALSLGTGVPPDPFRNVRLMFRRG